LATIEPLPGVPSGRPPPPCKGEGQSASGRLGGGFSLELHPKPRRVEQRLGVCRRDGIRYRDRIRVGGQVLARVEQGQFADGPDQDATGGRGADQMRDRTGRGAGKVLLRGLPDAPGARSPAKPSSSAGRAAIPSAARISLRRITPASYSRASRSAFSETVSRSAAMPSTSHASRAPLAARSR